MLIPTRSTANSRPYFFAFCSTCILVLICLYVLPISAQVQDRATQELLRQQERERVLREQLETTPDSRLQRPVTKELEPLPINESPCFPIHQITLVGEEAKRFQWALAAADPKQDPATGRCLGTEGINIVITRIQNAIVERGYVTTRALASPQDLNGGVLQLTLVPGRIREIRFAPGTEPSATLWNAIPARPGDLLNLRDIEQGLENFKRVPTVDADIQIVPADGPNAAPGESDLVISWTQSRLIRANITLDDSGSKATGKMQANATVSLDHILQQNDLFYVNVGHDAFNSGKRGTQGYTVHYSVPMGYWLASITASRYDYHQEVAGNTQNYVYSGRSRNSELRLSRLLYRDATSKTSAYGRVWHRDSKNFIDDTEVLVQRRRMAGWELGLSHRQFIGQATLDVGANYRHGTRMFNALAAPEEAFGEGKANGQIYSADAQLNVPFTVAEQRLRYSGSWRAQWNNTPLVPQDRFSIGGRYTVRGFDGELSLSGERGWLVRNDIGLALSNTQELYVGADIGRIGGPSTKWQLGNSLAGGVFGLRGSHRELSWDVFIGKPFDKPRGFQTASTTTGFSLSASF